MKEDKEGLKILTLNNGITIPLIGNGPGIIESPAKHRSNDNTLQRSLIRIYNKLHRMIYGENKYIGAVVHSLQTGFALLDFSAAYGDEQLIGKAIKRSGIERCNLFLTTRVSNQQQLKGNIREEFFNTLKNYRTGYVDLYMLHWPVDGVYLDSWKQMEQLYNEGYCRAIGVANCHRRHLDAILRIAEIAPAVNQIEIHPLFTQKTLIEYCQSKNIAVEAYTPIARFDDRLVKLPALKEIAKKHNKSIAQVILRWHIQNGVIPIVRSLNTNHQKGNISIFDFELTDEDMQVIDGFNINSRLRYDPDNCDFSIL
jgi:diketogulonate reductase-like aldo/keto reductase